MLTGESIAPQSIASRQQDCHRTISLSRPNPKSFPQRRGIDHPLALVADFQAIFERDPAARNWLEVLLCSPGLHALAGYRVAHWFHRRGLPFLPRFISHIVRGLTGIEIHPAAQVGRGVVIDHGMGVVIGETAIVGDHALIYQGVTLGGTGKETGKRHPTLGRNVVVGAGAKVLGNIYIGDVARIGAGAVVLRDVPSHCTVVGVPARSRYPSNLGDGDLTPSSAPNAETTIQQLVQRIEQLETEMTILKGQADPVPIALRANSYRES